MYQYTYEFTFFLISTYIYSVHLCVFKKSILKYGKFLKFTGKTNSTWLSRPMVTIVLMKVLVHIPAFQAPVSLIQIIMCYQTQKLRRIWVLIIALFSSSVTFLNNLNRHWWNKFKLKELFFSF